MELRGKYTLDAMVADLHAILAHLSSPPVLVGVSMGGLSALAAAGEAIAPIARALVLVDVTPRINAGGAEKIMTFMRSHVQGFASLDEAAQAVTARAPYKPKQIGWIK
jgi:pimeloyl-ACP methyl ester carboxylesterase